MFFWQPLVLPPSVKDNLLDFGIRSATHTSSIIFVVVNSNPIEVRAGAFICWNEMNSVEYLSDFLELLVYRASLLLPNMSIVQSTSILNMLTCAYFCFNTRLHCNTICTANTFRSGRIFDNAEKEQFPQRTFFARLSYVSSMSFICGLRKELRTKN